MTTVIHRATQFEATPVSNPYRLPGILQSDWDVFGEATNPFHHFDTTLSVAHADYETTYIGLKTGRQQTPQDYIPIGPALFIAETRLIYKIGTANVYNGRARPDVEMAPFIGWTSTDASFRRGGRGLRRLQIANQMALRYFSQPLHSGHEPSPAARHLWRHLVNSGQAEVYNDGPNGVFERYKFVADEPAATYGDTE